MPAWLVALAVSVVLNVAAYLIAPKPKGPKSDAVREGENPTASAGKPWPVVFGTVVIKEVNVLGYWDKGTRSYKVKA